MEFSLDRFYRMNRRVIIWLVLFGLIYILREFFLLIFLTFVIGFFASPAADALVKRLRMSRGLALTLVYGGILVAYIMTALWISPKVLAEVGKVVDQYPNIRVKIEEKRHEYSERYPQIAKWITVYEPEENLLADSRLLNQQRELLDALLEGLKTDISPETDPLFQDGEEAAPETSATEARDTGESAGSAPTGSVDVALVSHIGEDNAAEGGDDDDRAVARADPDEAGDDEFIQFGQLDPKIQELLISLAKKQGVVASIPIANSELPFIERKINEYEGRALDVLTTAGSRVIRFAVTSLLAILFSYLITMDFARLARQVRSLQTSNLRDFYEEAGEPVIKFVQAIGRGFQAIVVISFITALLLAVVLLILGIPKPQVLLLTVIVFCTSLVPIVGVAVEMTSIQLVTFNAFGMDWHFWAIMISTLVVHGAIGYAIAPIIFGRQFRLNPVLVLIILYIGQKLFGLWGLILGVPVANYLIRDVFAVPIVEEESDEDPPAPPVTRAGKPGSAGTGTNPKEPRLRPE